MGVGVNAGRSAFPQNLREVADTLRLSQRQKKQLILEIIQSLIEIITFSSPNIMEKYREQNVLLNKEIIYHKNGSEKFARVEGIDDRGALLVRFENGESTCLLSGEVSVRKCER